MSAKLGRPGPAPNRRIVEGPATTFDTRKQAWRVDRRGYLFGRALGEYGSGGRTEQQLQAERDEFLVLANQYLRRLRSQLPEKPTAAQEDLAAEEADNLALAEMKRRRKRALAEIKRREERAPSPRGRPPASPGIVSQFAALQRKHPGLSKRSAAAILAARLQLPHRAVEDRLRRALAKLPRNSRLINPRG